MWSRDQKRKGLILLRHATSAVGFFGFDMLVKPSVIFKRIRSNTGKLKVLLTQARMRCAFPLTWVLAVTTKLQPANPLICTNEDKVQESWPIAVETVKAVLSSLAHRRFSVPERRAKSLAKPLRVVLDEVAQRMFSNVFSRPRALEDKKTFVCQRTHFFTYQHLSIILLQ